MAEHDRERNQARNKPPISRHPLFPAVVALWFGAAFGLGSLAIRPGLIEDLVLAAHIDTLIPAAAPPLGTTPRLLLALLMAGLGGLIGASLTRRLTRPKPEPRQRGTAAKSAEANRFAAADMDDPAGNANKRRSLALAEDIVPHEMREYAPLPGGPLILNVADIDVGGEPDHNQHDLAPASRLSAEQPQSGDGLRWTGLADDPPYERPDAVLAAPAQPQYPDHGLRFDMPAPAAQEASVEAARRAFDPAPFASGPTGPQDTQAQEVQAEAPVAAHAGGRLFDRTDAPPPFAQADDDTVTEDVIADTPVHQDSDFARPEIEAQPAAQPPAPTEAGLGFKPLAGKAAERLTSADLGALSPVELIERLAISIERRRGARQNLASAAALAGAAKANTEAAMEPQEPVAAAIADDIAPVLPRFAATAPPPPLAAIPAAMRPLAFEDDDDDDDEDDAYGFVPLRQMAHAPEVAPVPAAENAPKSAESCDPVLPEEPVLAEEPGMAEDDDGQALEDGYSSLLELSRQGPGKPSLAKQVFIRIEDADDDETGAIEPVVIFPGQAGRQALAPMPSAGRDEAPAQDAGPTAPSDEQPQSTGRLFDAPGPRLSGTAQPRAHNREDAEHALRSALATLQRMSGAA